jgi:hypothetical protein
MNQNKNISETLSWTAQSHIQPKRSPIWYLFFALVSLGLLAYAIYTRSPLTLITFFLIIVVLLIVSVQPSAEIQYKITKTGITAGHVIYPFKVIKTFWIVYNPPQVKTLNFETSAYINNKITLQLGKQDPVELKQVLGRYLPEDLDKEESLSETLARKLKI